MANAAAVGANTVPATKVERFASVLYVALLSVVVTLTLALPFIGDQPVHVGAELTPGWATIGAFIAGCALAQLLLLSPATLRFGLIAAPLIAGLPDRYRPLALLFFAPTIVVVMRRLSLRQRSPWLSTGGIAGLIALAIVFVAPEIVTRVHWPLLGLLGAVAFLIGWMLPRLTVSPKPASRWDLRASLATGTMVVAGLIAAALLLYWREFALTPRSYDGLGAPNLKVPIASTVIGIVGLLLGVGKRPLAMVAGLVLTVIGLFGSLSGVFLLAGIAIGFVILLGLSLTGSDARLSRHREGLGVFTFGLSFAFGSWLAIRLFSVLSRPLPGIIIVNAKEVSARTDWSTLWLFYALVALVLLLAHLAFLYEFGLPPLSPDDDQDRIPIKREGVAGWMKARKTKTP